LSGLQRIQQQQQQLTLLLRKTCKLPVIRLQRQSAAAAG
jgi:hypothetical protein